MAGKDAPPPSSAGEEIGRISSLPDGIREHVLSFLPAHEAVRTTVLARSWRDLWMGSRKLRITGWGTVAKFSKFVFRLLRVRRGTRISRRHGAGNRGVAWAPLDSCDFTFSTEEFDDEEGELDITKAMVNGWISCALRCKVRVLCFWFERCDADHVELHQRPLASEHLRSLYLSGIVVNDNLDLSACPALVDLTLDASILSPAEIWSPSLQLLSLSYCAFLLLRTRIRVPSLVWLEFAGCDGRCPVLERMPLVGTAVVIFDFGDLYDQCSDSTIHGCGSEHCKGCRYYNGPHNDHRSCLVLNGMSEVKHLELSSDPDVFVFSRDIKNCPIFRNLRTSLLDDWFVADDFSGLIGFLQHSPILEKLTLQLSKVRTNAVRTEGTSKPLEQSVISDHLKTVEIKCHELNAMVLKILKILAAFGTQRELINIQCSIRHAGCGFLLSQCANSSETVTSKCHMMA